MDVTIGKQGPYSLFTEKYYANFRFQASFLTHEPLDLVTLGSVMSTINDRDVVSSRHRPAKQQHSIFIHAQSILLMQATLNFLYGVGKHQVLVNFLEYSSETVVHGNSRKRPHNSLTC